MQGERSPTLSENEEVFKTIERDSIGIREISLTQGGVRPIIDPTLPTLEIGGDSPPRCESDSSKERDR